MALKEHANSKNKVRKHFIYRSYDVVLELEYSNLLFVSENPNLETLRFNQTILLSYSKLVEFTRACFCVFKAQLRQFKLISTTRYSTL